MTSMTMFTLNQNLFNFIVLVKSLSQYSYKFGELSSANKGVISHAIFRDFVLKSFINDSSLIVRPVYANNMAKYIVCQLPIPISYWYRYSC